MLVPWWIAAALAGTLVAAPDAAIPGLTAPPLVDDEGLPPALVRPGGPSGAEILHQRAEAFGRFRAVETGPSRSIGGYSNGCLVGAAPLPVSGPGFEVLHLGRHRRYGHPDLVAFVRRLAKEARRKGLGPLLIGDLSQPRGGPTLTGHKSHQTGLDVDVGFTHPAWMQKRKLTEQERETLSPPAVVDLKTHALTSAWNPKVEALIQLAARDPAVDRLFVNPSVKQRLCKDVKRDRGWLHTVRPWWAHHDHLHVRLKCPAGSTECERQTPNPPGDGCGELEWWLGEARKPRETPPPPPVEARPPPPLPSACRALFASSADAPP